MLPFLKRNQDASASSPVESVERKPDEPNEEFDGLEGAMRELQEALSKKDYKEAASCFRAAFDLLEMQPHDEISHTNE